MRDVEGNQRDFYRYLHSKRKARENMSLLLTGAQDPVEKKLCKRLRCLAPSLSWSLLVKLTLRNPKTLRLAGKSITTKVYPW